VSVGEPENKDDFIQYSREDMFLYVEKSIHTDFEKVMIKLQSPRSKTPRLVASGMRNSQ